MEHVRYVPVAEKITELLNNQVHPCLTLEKKKQLGNNIPVCGAQLSSVRPSGKSPGFLSLLWEKLHVLLPVFMMNKFLFSKSLHSSIFLLLCWSLCLQEGDFMVLLLSDAAVFFRALGTGQWWVERAVKTVGCSRVWKENRRISTLEFC